VIKDDTNKAIHGGCVGSEPSVQKAESNHSGSKPFTVSSNHIFLQTVTYFDIAQFNVDVETERCGTTPLRL